MNSGKGVELVCLARQTTVAKPDVGLSIGFVKLRRMTRCFVSHYALLIFAGMLWASLGIHVGLSQPLLPVSSVSPSFKAPAVSPGDSNAVIRLAAKAGLTNVAKIELNDSDTIMVLGPEAIKGREVSFVSIRIDEGSSSNPFWIWDRTTNLLCSDEKYFVLRTSVRTNKLTLFEVKNQTIRVELGPNVSLSQADQLVGALEVGNIRYTSEDVRRRAVNIDLSKPCAIGQIRSGVFGITFLFNRSCYFAFQCVFENDEIVAQRPLTDVCF
jgi:hypothetical protein